jgi:hypothetical protein
MATFKEQVDELAQAIRTATAQDQINQLRAKQAGKQIANASDRAANTITALKRVAKTIDTLVTPEGTPWSEEEKEAISRSVAESLGLKKPDRFRFATKQASIDNIVVVIQDIEDIIKDVK